MPTAISTSTIARLAMVSIVLYQILLIVLIFLRPDLAPSWHSISEWAIGPFGWLMTTAFFVSAIGYLALLVALKPFISKGAGYIGWILLLICVIGTAGVGIFTTDPMGHPNWHLTTRGQLHIVTGSTALIFFPFAALFMTIGLRKNPVTPIRLWIGFIPLTGFAIFVLYTLLFVVPKGPGAYGPGVNIGWPPRIAFFSYMVWVVIISRAIIRTQKSGFHISEGL